MRLAEGKIIPCGKTKHAESQKFETASLKQGTVTHQILVYTLGSCRNHRSAGPRNKVHTPRPG